MNHRPNRSGYWPSVNQRNIDHHEANTPGHRTNGAPDDESAYMTARRLAESP